MGQLVGQPALDGAVAHHHQAPAQRIDARAQAQGGRVGVHHEAVGEQRVLAHDVFKRLQRLLVVDGLHELEDHRVRRLLGVVAQAVEHVLGRPSGQGHRIAVVQAVFHEGPAGDVFVHLASQHRAGSALGRRWGRSGCGAARAGWCGLQCGHGVFGAQCQQAVVKAAGYLGFGQLVHVAAPHEAQPALVRSLHAVINGRVRQPLAAHLDPWRGTRGVFEQVAQQLAGLCRDQQRRRAGRPQLLQRAQQVAAIDGGRGLVVGIQLDACEFAGSVPQRAVAQDQAT